MIIFWKWRQATAHPKVIIAGAIWESPWNWCMAVTNLDNA
ncbi:hypothetical protein CWATWH0005_5805 [Crocosphaera watsonii WH 0005]|uniref:Uncharacterized protein n=1 Tax=Crocosphaera watsonii WH 0005 TaxID=423472 RepID=T2J0M3_CROWT|nr:hypothetical protein CWATWH0005_5805 [Crocosphaera watsonii WH 0005]